MQLITFLGTGKYQPTCYTWQEKEYKTEYVSEAIYEFFQPDKVSVLVTIEAKKEHWEKLEERLKDKVTDVLIPSGKSEKEVWEIFDAVVKTVEPGAKVIFDISHGFRSVPILVLLAAAFLEKARGVEIKGVYYGAFEVNREKPPIFDLTPAVKLLDWLTATDKFINTGSSVELGKLLSEIQKDFYRNNKQKDSNLQPQQLINLSKYIQAISRSIELVRPRDLISESYQLSEMEVTQLENEVGIFAKPFELLLSQIQQDYEQFALPSQSTPKEELEKHFLLLRWYVSKGMSLQAILLAREWLVSVLCLAEGITDYQNTESRRPIERQLGLMTSDILDLDQPVARHVKSAKKLSGFWSKLTTYRNDIAHTQMKLNPISASSLQKYTNNQLIQDLSELLPEWVI